MKTRLLIAAGVMAVSASLAGPGVAQELTIDGIAVPAGELEAVQMKCEELISLRATAVAQPDAATPAADAPAAGANVDAAATESAAEAPVDPAATAVAEAPAGGNMAAEPAAGAIDPAAAVTIDLASLTAELCEEGGFKPEMD